MIVTVNLNDKCNSLQRRGDIAGARAHFTACRDKMKYIAHFEFLTIAATVHDRHVAFNWPYVVRGAGCEDRTPPL